MYPVPAQQVLSLREIANHWSRQIDPRRSKKVLTRFLERAWWRGEFASHNQITRLAVLKALFAVAHADLPFWVKGEKEPQTLWDMPDGGVETLLMSVIPVPSANAGDWAESDCEAAFSIIADHWRDRVAIPPFELVTPVVSSVCLSEVEFSRWLSTWGYTRPDFWSLTEQQPHRDQGSKNSNKRRGPLPKVTDRVEREMRKQIRDGKYTAESFSRMKELALASLFGVSRETANKALHRILSESVGDKNSG